MKYQEIKKNALLKITIFQNPRNSDFKKFGSLNHEDLLKSNSYIKSIYCIIFRCPINGKKILKINKNDFKVTSHTT